MKKQTRGEVPCAHGCEDSASVRRAFSPAGLWAEILRIPAGFVAETDKLTLKFRWKFEGPRRAETVDKQVW